MTHDYENNRAICTRDIPVETIGEAVRADYRHVDCEDCLRRAIAETNERASVLQELLEAAMAPVTKRCRVYDALCINPSYCDAKDACCAGDPACRTELP